MNLVTRPVAVLPVAIPILLLAACSGAAITIPGSSDGSPPDDAGLADSARVRDARAEARPRQAGSVSIHLKATTSPFVHHDDWSSQTPSDQRIGIRSLSLASSADDPSPWVVFDLGKETVEAGLNDGDDTLVASFPSSALETGRYAYARVGVAYVRYAVAATVHEGGLAVPGTFHNLEVLSDDTVVDGQTHTGGYFAFSFVVGSFTYGPVTGNTAPLPASAGLGITLAIENGQAAYGFPVSLDVQPAAASLEISMLANVSEDFRWMDESRPGYTAGVFDVTPPSSYEPVEQFGANSLSLSVEAQRP